MAQYRILAYVGLVLGVALSSACRAEMRPVTEAHSPHDQTAQHEGSVEAAMGFWSVTAPHGRARCMIALNREAAGANYGVYVEACTIKALASITAWRPTREGFELLPSGNAPGLRFRQTGVDNFESHDGVLKVSRAAVP